MLELIKPQSKPATLLDAGLPSGTGSEMDVYIQRSNMADTLFSAVAECRFSKVHFQFAHGVSANITNDKGYNMLVTALHIEDNDKRDRMFRYLLKRRVDGCHVDGSTGRDVLMWACLLGRHVQVSHLMEDSVGELDFTRTDKQGMTALHHATIQGHIEVVRLLIAAMNKYRLAVDVTDKQGLTPFIYAKRLGHFAIADVLLRDGHCSPRQFDDVMHKSVEDWVQIGTRERRELNKQQYRDMMAQYMVYGKIPGRITQKPLNKSRLQLPIITVSGTEGTRNLTLLEPERGDGSLRSEITAYDHAKGRRRPFPTVAGWSQLETNLPSRPYSASSGQLGPSRRFLEANRRGKISPRVAEERLASPGPIAQAIHNKSLDTAFALLDVQANQSSEIVHADQFVHSQLDTSKINECSGMMGNLTSMMDILSQQQSGAFRVVAKPTSAPMVPHGSSRVSKRKNVSTLALLFGKNNTSRRYRLAARSNKQKKKTLGQNVKTKKQKTTVKQK